jgi:hypothetical protein
VLEATAVIVVEGGAGNVEHDGSMWCHGAAAAWMQRR